MKCPIDDAQLVMSERSGIEIDYCPQCRGVWLDRGELDKIVERAAVTSTPVPQQRNTFDRPQDRGGHSGDSHGGQGQRRRKENWLGELFG